MDVKLTIPFEVIHFGTPIAFRLTEWQLSGICSASLLTTVGARSGTAFFAPLAFSVRSNGQRRYEITT